MVSGCTVSPSALTLPEKEGRVKCFSKVEYLRVALTFTSKEAREYARKNLYATMMFGSAGEDYIACRCCVLGGLYTGLRFGSEAVEKILKAHIYLATGAKRRGHNPYLLKQELIATHPDPKLNSFDDPLRKLYGHYQRRYYDNPERSQGASCEELSYVDDLFIYLVETLPMPDEVKYRGMFFALLCDETTRRFTNFHWATHNNRALQGKLELMERRYQQVYQHLYGANRQ
jgi:hypothetical protein